MLVTSGHIFGELTFVEEVPSHITGHRAYKCICSCGNTHISTRNNLLRGITSRCTDCSIATRSKSATKYETKKYKYTYASYRAMLRRCSEFDRYKNVPICEEWKQEGGFINFLKDMGERPQNHTLDRIDNSKGYYKENCRWATFGVQNHNKSKPKTQNSSSCYKGVTYDRGRWVVQFMVSGQKTVFNATSELDAATEYDNLSEKYYGDRPNKTEPRVVVPKPIKRGGITLDQRSLRFRVRVTVDGLRQTLGYFDTKEEAIEALDEFLQKE